MPPSSAPKPRPKVCQPYTVNGAFAIDIHEAALLTGFSVKSLRARIHRRIIPYRRAGGRILFCRRDLEDWFNGLSGVSIAEARANMEARQ